MVYMLSLKIHVEFSVENIRGKHRDIPILLNVYSGMPYSRFNPCDSVCISALTNNAFTFLEEIIQLEI